MKTYLEVLWQGKTVWVHSILSKSGKMHYELRKYIGRAGYVLGESKNRQLLIEFSATDIRAIPPGCVVQYGTVHRALTKRTVGKFIRSKKSS